MGSSSRSGACTATSGWAATSSCRRWPGSGSRDELGEELRAGDKRHFHELIDECELMPDARRLIEVLHERGAEIVLASSASAEDLDHYRAMLDADDLIHAATSSADVERTKPEPDLILAAMEKVSGPDAGRDGRRLDLGLRGRAARRDPLGRPADRGLRRVGAARGGRRARCSSRSPT